MDETAVIALVAGIVAAVGATLRGIARDIAGLLVGVGVALLGLAAFLGNL